MTPGVERGEQARIASLVRETLEGVVRPPMASALVLKSLSDAELDAIPTERRSLKAFVGDCLAPRLGALLGEASAVAIVDTLCTRIDRVFGELSQHPSQLPTSNNRVEKGPVRLLVIAGTRTLAQRIQSALGANVVCVHLGSTSEVAVRITSGLRPRIVLFDVTSPLPFDPTRSAEVLREVNPLVVVWGVEGRDGLVACERLSDIGLETVGLHSREGAESLMDYVLARYVPEQAL